MKFTLRQLEVFLATAKYQSISKAAESLYLSQSATSESLLTLERSYDTQLFDRVKNRLVLSAVGKSLRQDAEILLQQCHSFDDSLQMHKDVGHLKIGASFTIGNHLATRYLGEYLRHFPEADVQLDIANTPDVVSKVLNYEVDIGMIEAEVQHKDLKLIPWQEDELVCFCSKDHPLAKQKILKMRDIKNADWILREPDSGARQTFERAMSGVLPQLNVLMEFKHNEAIKNAVESGLGIGCLSKIVLRRSLENGDLVPLQLPGRPMRRVFYFALPKNFPETAVIRAWMDTCIATNA